MYALNPNPHKPDQSRRGDGGCWGEEGFAHEQEVGVGDRREDIGKDVGEPTLARAIAV